MEDRAVKKLVITLAVAIVIIMLFKFFLTRTYSNLNKGIQTGKANVTVPSTNSAPATIPSPAYFTAASDVGPADAASSVGATQN